MTKGLANNVANVALAAFKGTHTVAKVAVDGGKRVLDAVNFSGGKLADAAHTVAVGIGKVATSFKGLIAGIKGFDRV